MKADNDYVITALLVTVVVTLQCIHGECVTFQFIPLHLYFYRTRQKGFVFVFYSQQLSSFMMTFFMTSFMMSLEKVLDTCVILNPKL